MKKNDSIFSRLTPTNKKIDTELEEILDKKEFIEEVQSLILSMFYKIDNAYPDYYMVKRQMPTKDIFNQNITNIINNYCNEIEIIKARGKRNEINYKIDVKNGKLECIENEDILLGCIFELIHIESNSDDLLGIAYSSFLKHGNSLNNQEVIRAFNGWSWQDTLIVPYDIQTNLIYQNLLLLLNFEKLQEIINSKSPIYQTKKYLEEIYGFELGNEVIKYILAISSIIKANRNKEYRVKFEKYINALNDNFKKMDNKDELIAYTTDKRKQITAEIGEIDKKLNNIEYLKKDFEERNKNLEKNKKIFSISALVEMYETKRKKLLKEMKEYSNLVEPRQYLSKKEELQDNISIFEKIDFTKEDKINIEKIIIEFQHVFFKCFEKKIKESKEKKDMVNLIYNFRYYYFLNYKKNSKICNSRILEKQLMGILDILIKKAEELKVIDKFSNDDYSNIEIIKNILSNEIINLENIIIQINECDEKGNVFTVQYYDGAMQVKEKNLKLDQVIYKKRKIKLFI